MLLTRGCAEEGTGKGRGKDEHCLYKQAGSLVNLRLMTAKFKSSVFFLFLVFLPLVCHAAQKTDSGSLSDKDLKIQRYFAEITILTKKSDAFENFYFEKGQLALKSYRYQLAFLGYAIAAAAAKTPAYREPYQKMLKKTIEMMVDKRTWDFVETYWKNEPTFPDPVVHENIMYSGHLAQLLVLYQALFNDEIYDTKGFDFVWDEKTKIHYTTRKLLEVLKKQSDEEPSGGIPCEPNLVFAPCNQHPQLAFLLYDRMKGTKFSTCALKWKNFLQKEFPYQNTKKGIFKANYNRHTKTFLPAASPALDGWTYAWMIPWTDDMAFMKEGLEKIKNYKNWKSKDDALILRSTPIDKAADVSDAFLSMFFPLIARQIEGAESEFAQKIVNGYEQKYAKEDDLNGDGKKESFYYDAGPDKVAVTASLATAFLTDGDSLRAMYQKAYGKNFFKLPYVQYADYPNVYVKLAYYDEKNKTLHVELIPGDANAGAETQLVLANIKKVKKVTRNNAEIKAFSLSKNTLTIPTNIEDKNEFVFEVE